ncbi:MAG: aminodeoxychorismate synthase component I [Deltaproteobacteria bacterium]|nr:aminodeoxychorismate synthase component I [Deltaproteobacteria bacterium]
MIINPVIKEIPFSIKPFDAFAFVKGQPYPFFLDSSFDLKGLGRYSFLGASPYKIIRSKGNTVEVESFYGNYRYQGNAFDFIGEELKRFSIASEHYIPFLLGGVGYFSYDLLHLLEDIPSKTVDDIGFPDCHIAFYDTSIAFDNHENKGYVVSITENKVDEVIESLRNMECGMWNLTPNSKLRTPNFTSNFTKEDYIKAVQKAKEYIAAGDIYQVNLSQRFSTEIDIPPYDLYLRLREASPAPFSAYLDFGKAAILSSSPERFLKVDGGCIETRPIKGTRPRGESAEEDERLKGELVSSGKDRAEHIMIVDLERNDLGKVCKYGSVNVKEEMAVESFAQVHHMVSTIAGELKEGISLMDVMKATYPGGSITGAPKVRAMEIIEELEPVKRGVYTGSIGYIGFNGKMDMNIAIRTLSVIGGVAYFSVGGGIVADSDPEAEYQETLDKAKGMMEALKAGMRVEG